MYRREYENFFPIAWSLGRFAIFLIPVDCEQNAGKQAATTL